MGMYDYLEGLIVECPVCHKKRDRDWQIKGLSMSLSTYRVGDEITKYVFNEDIINNKIDTNIDKLVAIGNCPICNTQHIAIVKIKDGITTPEHAVFNAKEWFDRC